MNRHRNGAKRRETTVRAWTYDQAQAVLPYIVSVMKSLREHALAAQVSGRALKRLESMPGRPDRKRILAETSVKRQLEEAREQYRQTEEELHRLDIFCIDPIRGEAVIPFAHADQLAWFLFDLFDSKPLRFWRYHSDPLETRRPIDEALTALTEGPRVA